MSPKCMHGTLATSSGGESCRVLVVHIGYMGISADDASCEICGGLFGGICDAVSKKCNPLLNSMLGP